MSQACFVKSFLVSNTQEGASIDDFNVSVVGIGRVAGSIAQLLFQAPVRVTCHEVFARPRDEPGTSLKALIDKLSEEDLVFLVWEALDGPETEILRDLANLPRREGSLPLLVGVTPEEMDNRLMVDAMLNPKMGLDSLFLLSSEMRGSKVGTYSQSDQDAPTFDDLARHLITVLTQLNQQRCFIGIDFNDIVIILKSGKVGRMGLGIATGPKRIENASRMAIDPLNNHLTKATGVLAILREEQDLSAEDFCKASDVLHQHIFPGDWPFIVGLVHDDSMGRRAEVTVLSIEATQNEICEPTFLG